MPSMANITVKNGAGTDTTAVALTPSAGDTVAAQWRVEDVSIPPIARTTFSIVSRYNAARDARRVEWKTNTPYAVEGTNGLFTVVANIPGSGSYVLPLVAPTDVSLDASAFMTSFIASTLILNVLRSGYAPT